MRVLAFLVVLSAACVPQFGQRCESDDDCGELFCDDGRCSPRAPIDEVDAGVDDAGVPGDGGPTGPEFFVGPGERCDDVVVGCEGGRECVYLGERPNYSVCEPDLADPGCATEGQFAATYCTVNTDEDPPHTVTCAARCIARHPDRAGAEGDTCTADADCSLNACVRNNDDGTLECRSDRGYALASRPSARVDSFEPACAIPLEAEPESGAELGIHSCRSRCEEDTDCATENFFENLCNRQTGICEVPGCNFSDCEPFPGTSCRFVNFCMVDQSNFRGETCTGGDSCIGTDQCINADGSTGLCEPFAPVNGGCGEGYQEITMCDEEPCRQACVSNDFCANREEKCGPNPALLGETVLDEDACAIPFEGFELGEENSSIVCMQPCTPTQGQVGGQCSDDPQLNDELCDFQAENLCPLPLCDRAAATTGCGAGETCVASPIFFVRPTTNQDLFEFCLETDECRLDADCGERCSMTTRQCAVACPSCNCATTLIEEGFQSANFVREPVRLRGASGVVVGNTPLMVGGNTGSAFAGEFLFSWNADGASWTEIFDFQGAPADRDRPAAASDGTRMYMHGGGTPNTGDAGPATDASDELFSFDLDGYVWTPISALVGTPPSLEGHTMNFVNGRLILIGGRGDDGEASADVHVYEIATETWTTQTPVGGPGPIADHGALLMDSGEILVVGNNTSIFTLDPTTLTWTERATGVALLNRAEASLVRDPRVTEERYLLIGGKGNDVARADSVLIDAAFQSSAGPTLPEAIGQPVALVHPLSNRLVVVGEQVQFVYVPEPLCLE